MKMADMKLILYQMKMALEAEYQSGFPKFLCIFAVSDESPIHGGVNQK